MRSDTNTPDDFWAKVDKSGECWMWRGRLTPAGYGSLHYEGKLWYAHRLAYTLSIGPITDGLFCCHRCDQPGCVNPAHLFLGTNRDNMLDCKAKGRIRWGVTSGEQHYSRTRPWLIPRGEQSYTHMHPECMPRGERNGSARLTGDQVREIRARHAAGGVTQQQLADAYGVNFGTISQIVLRKTWRHIE